MPELGAEGVEGLAEFVVVGTQRPDHRPDRGELRGAQHRVGVVGVGDEHRDDDRAGGLVVGEANGAPDGLDDVDF